jgi:hypothetical protein
VANILLHQTPFHKTEKRSIPDNNVIKYLDTHNITGLLQSAGDGYVLGTGSRIAGGVIVDKNDCGGRLLDGRAENLTGMYDRLI